MASDSGPRNTADASDSVRSRSFHGTRWVSTNCPAPARVACSPACRAVRCRFGGLLGLVWNDARGVWVQYENGKVVRVIDPEN